MTGWCFKKNILIHETEKQICNPCSHSALPVDTGCGGRMTIRPNLSSRNRTTAGHAEITGEFFLNPPEFLTAVSGIIRRVTERQVSQMVRGRSRSPSGMSPIPRENAPSHFPLPRV